MFNGQCSIANTYESNECRNGKLVLPLKMSQSHNKSQFTVLVEGNIGSGKSTFLNYFKNSAKVEVLNEPVEKWTNVRGNNTLDLIYKDPQRWSYMFQSYVLLTMLENHTCSQKKGVKMLERSIFSGNYCFVENLYQSGLMSSVDYAVLNEWFDFVVKKFQLNVDLIVYLRASPESCLERIKQRNRSEEADVPMEYLESLHELHENWLVRNTKFRLPAPVLILDAEQSLSELRNEMERRQEEILCGCV